MKQFRQEQEEIRHGLPASEEGIGYEIFEEDGNLHIRFLDTGKEMLLPVHANVLTKANFRKLSRKGLFPKTRITTSAITATSYDENPNDDTTHYFGVEAVPRFFAEHLNTVASEITRYHFFLGTITFRKDPKLYRATNIVFNAEMGKYSHTADQIEMIHRHILSIDKRLLSDEIVISIWSDDEIVTLKYVKSENDIVFLSRRPRKKY